MSAPAPARILVTHCVAGWTAGAARRGAVLSRPCPTQPSPARPHTPLLHSPSTSSPHTPAPGEAAGAGQDRSPSPSREPPFPRPPPASRSSPSSRSRLPLLASPIWPASPDPEPHSHPNPLAPACFPAHPLLAPRPSASQTSQNWYIWFDARNRNRHDKVSLDRLLPPLSPSRQTQPRQPPPSTPFVTIRSATDRLSPPAPSAYADSPSVARLALVSPSRSRSPRSPGPQDHAQAQIAPPTADHGLSTTGRRLLHRGLTRELGLRPQG